MSCALCGMNNTHLKHINEASQACCSVPNDEENEVGHLQDQFGIGRDVSRKATVVHMVSTCTSWSDQIVEI